MGFYFRNSRTGTLLFVQELKRRNFPSGEGAVIELSGHELTEHFLNRNGGLNQVSSEPLLGEWKYHRAEDRDFTQLNSLFAVDFDREERRARPHRPGAELQCDRLGNTRRIHERVGRHRCRQTTRRQNAHEVRFVVFSSTAF